jgi:hypothetical protein
MGVSVSARPRWSFSVAGGPIMIMRITWGKLRAGFSVSLWDSLDAMQAYEQSAVFTQEIQPTLQPFFAGEYTTYRCDVKYDQ